MNVSDPIVLLKKQISAVTSVISTLLFYFGLSIEFIFFAFLIHQFVRKKTTSKICTAYFRLLALGYFVDLFYVIIWLAEIYLTSNKAELGIFGLFLMHLNSITQWHALIFMGPWNVLLAINRLSSLIYMNNYEKLWSKYFCLAVGIILVYPFITDGYSFLDLHCRFHLQYPECFDYFKQTFNFTAISNGIFAILSVIIGIATYYMYRKNLGTSIISIKKDKTEQKLLFQSLSISTFFGLYCIFTGLYHLYSNATTSEGKLTFTIINFLFSLSKFFHHYFSIILLFFFS